MERILSIVSFVFLLFLGVFSIQVQNKLNNRYIYLAKILFIRLNESLHIVQRLSSRFNRAT